ncbi:efflux RND transporter periplasmic adaptor subunit [Mucilaginibacter gotjawali]|uniref:Multidrug resistance protein MexA n=2 Tax=Mucilaginibacter gotjawali TaxID=1550579 RepID=A0A110B2P6_9SPHI|nr:efflux RND transporter periplasmic adaptor subunit [Mucilaginibacter gotjawali]MBB3056131.1 membrane fusion protein (multidrug efflux system) [Mucilaginibacter gotjawali]BAU53532.1 Multidrug resistance protein MexA precursor [Mucilaginibacter gotjawali]
MNRVLLNSVFASCLVIAACTKKQAPPNPEVPVNLQIIKPRTVLYYEKIPATTRALNQVNLLPQVSGAVTGIFFTEGTKVNKGQKLYEIDERLYKAAYDQAVANLEVTKSSLVQAQQDADRYTYLNKYNAVAKQLYDHAVVTLEQAKSTVKASEQQVKTAKTNLTYATVFAPFTGTIGISQVRLGEVVTPSVTTLDTLSQDNPMAVDFIINEKNLPFFEKLQHEKTKVDSLFTLLMPDNSLYGHLGKLSIIDRAVDPQTGTIRVRLVFDNPDFYLRAGMSCVVRVHNQEAGPQLVVPNKAVVEQMGEYFVYIAKDTLIKVSPDSLKKMDKKEAAGANKPKLIAMQKKVQTGQVIGADIIIKSGIKAGDKIIVDGLQSLHDGVRITTANKVGPGGGKGGH